MKNFKNWLRTFGKIIVSPLPKTFIKESRKAKGKTLSALGWFLFVYIFGLIFSLVILKSKVSLYGIVAGLIFYPILFFLFVYCLNSLSKSLFHLNKDFHAEILYLVVGIYTPFSIIQAGINVLPKIGIIAGWISYIYPLILLTIAIKSLTKLNYWKTLVTIFLSSIIAILGLLFILPFFMNILFIMRNGFQANF